MILCPQLLSVLKAKLVQFVSCALSGPYILEVVYMGLVQLSSLVMVKDTETCASLFPKAKLGHLARVRHRSER